jgi:hydrogenase 3 maturation protease
VGNELRGDDALGLAVASELRKQLARGQTSGAVDPVPREQGTAGSSAPRDSEILVLSAGPAPEAYTSELRHFGAQQVFFIDAFDHGLEAGTISWIDEAQIDGASFSTHSMPLSLMAAFLRSDLGCEVGFLGIQAAGSAIGAPFSAPVASAVQVLASTLAEELREFFVPFVLS